MQDPLTVAFVIRRPWPDTRPPRFTPHARTGEGRWEISMSPFWIVAGRHLYWPGLITVWHRDPSGYDDKTCLTYPGNAWRFHVHHWKLQIHPLQDLRRWLLTRCEVCGGRSVKGQAVCVRSRHTPKAPWWRGETGLTHSGCLPSQRAES